MFPNHAIFPHLAWRTFNAGLKETGNLLQSVEFFTHVTIPYCVLACEHMCARNVFVLSTWLTCARVKPTCRVERINGDALSCHSHGRRHTVVRCNNNIFSFIFWTLAESNCLQCPLNTEMQQPVPSLSLSTVHEPSAKRSDKGISCWARDRPMLMRGK